MIWITRDKRRMHMHDMATEHLINALSMLWRILVQRELGVAVPETYEWRMLTDEEVHDKMRGLHDELRKRRRIHHALKESL